MLIISRFLYIRALAASRRMQLLQININDKKIAFLYYRKFSIYIIYVIRQKSLISINSRKISKAEAKLFYERILSSLIFMSWQALNKNVDRKTIRFFVKISNLFILFIFLSAFVLSLFIKFNNLFNICKSNYGRNLDF